MNNIIIESYYTYTVYSAYTVLITTLLTTSYLNFNDLAGCSCLLGLCFIIMGILHMLQSFILYFNVHNDIKNNLIKIGITHILLATCFLLSAFVIELYYINVYISMIISIYIIFIIIKYITVLIKNNFEFHLLN